MLPSRALGHMILARSWLHCGLCAGTVDAQGEGDDGDEHQEMLPGGGDRCLSGIRPGGGRPCLGEERHFLHHPSDAEQREAGSQNLA